MYSDSETSNQPMDNKRPEEINWLAPLDACFNIETHSGNVIREQMNKQLELAADTLYDQKAHLNFCENLMPRALHIVLELSLLWLVDLPGIQNY